jgi:hypothetical protein
MRHATVYHRKQQYLFHADSQTTAGVWILWGPVLSVADTSNDRALGLALRTALDGSLLGVPHPKRWGRTDPLSRLAGVKSYEVFAKDAECTGVHEEGERITLVPTRNLGPEEGFEDDPLRKLVLERATRAELGAALRRVMP